jgi:hypothetical protein
MIKKLIIKMKQKKCKKLFAKMNKTKKLTPNEIQYLELNEHVLD